MKQADPNLLFGQPVFICICRIFVLHGKSFLGPTRQPAFVSTTRADLTPGSFLSTQFGYAQFQRPNSLTGSITQYRRFIWIFCDIG